MTGIIFRNLLYWFLMLLFTPAFFLLMLLALPLWRGNILSVAVYWPKTMMWLLEHVIGLRYRLEGAEHIPARPSVICCKHQSGWETLATQVIFPLQVFVAKKELFMIPFFGWGLKLIGTIGIDRSNPAQATAQIIEQGGRRKAQGRWITIFPEGTRVKPGTKGRYKQGAARLAKLLEMDIVPVALNSGEYWPRNSFLKYPGEIRVIIAPPIAHDSGDIDELTRACEQAIESRMPAITGLGPCAAAANG